VIHLKVIKKQTASCGLRKAKKSDIGKEKNATQNKAIRKFKGTLLIAEGFKRNEGAMNIIFNCPLIPIHQECTALLSRCWFCSPEVPTL
jgi:hypothetical protein